MISYTNHKTNKNEWILFDNQNLFQIIIHIFEMHIYRFLAYYINIYFRTSVYFTSVSYTSECFMYFLMNELMAQQVIQP